MASFTSSQIVNITLWVLVGFSVLTWGIVFLKAFEQWRLGRANRAYSRAFWDAPDLAAAAQLKDLNGPLARVAKTGFEILKDGSAQGPSTLELAGDRQTILERSLRQGIQQERHRIEQGLTVLASVGSTSPFIGLFGTVWGIMHALKDISKSGSASLDVVAGPIGEALIATAIGIAAAIPAVLAYNFFLRRVKLYEAELEDFATDFLHLAMKTGFVLKTGA
ncbi:MotA/TolQ/ExbB proton channel family protein [Candidatus Methylocalor cossyra]|uniref:Biopolymer transport protein ExbB n=1 Tax=Candidatus Methylocalor cossyra TaxID=3108543 RepID=A0ABM9NKM3_9GAMM